MHDDETPQTFYNPHAFSFDPEVVIALMADTQIRKAIDRGEFDDLPGAGQPLDLSDADDPDWWIKKMMIREGIVKLPPSIQMRKEDAALDEQLDEITNEEAARLTIDEFNLRVIRARYEPPAGPPLLTMPRDVEATVKAWAARKAARVREARETGDQSTSEGSHRRRLFRKSRNRCEE